MKGKIYLSRADRKAGLEVHDVTEAGRELKKAREAGRKLFWRWKVRQRGMAGKELLRREWSQRWAALRGTLSHSLGGPHCCSRSHRTDSFWPASPYQRWPSNATKRFHIWHITMWTAESCSCDCQLNTLEGNTIAFRAAIPHRESVLQGRLNEAYEQALDYSSWVSTLGKPCTKTWKLWFRVSDWTWSVHLRVDASTTPRWRVRSLNGISTASRVNIGNNPVFGWQRLKTCALICRR